MGSHEEFKSKALEIFKKCQTEAAFEYVACKKEKVESYPGQHNFLCLNFENQAMVFCLHREKQNAGITSGGFVPTKTQSILLQ